MQDTDGDGQADRREVVLTGFGRDDTHELPNSLTWGPDGWLYGSTASSIAARSATSGTATYEFTCALFRIHPSTRAFELFCRGDQQSLGHRLGRRGQRIRQRLRDRSPVASHRNRLLPSGKAAPIRRLRRIIGSIVKHRHQKAAYCGIHYFDSDAYPARYRERLYMGNIHGGCLNVDRLERDGSTYRGIECPDFLTANDAWFMPVVQKTGPDGCLYVLDWYDRYHCYQDAGRDPEGIDRLKGRLYRIRYQNTPHVGPFDLAKETDEQLIARLSSPNVFYRDLAQRLLAERNHAETRPQLERLVLDDAAPRPGGCTPCGRWSAPARSTSRSTAACLAHADPTLRAWGVRAAGNFDHARPDLVPARVGPGCRSGPRRAAASGHRRPQVGRCRCPRRAAGDSLATAATTS